MMSSNDFLFASIHNVVETLIIAIILVILTIFFVILFTKMPKNSEKDNKLIISYPFTITRITGKC